MPRLFDPSAIPGDNPIGQLSPPPTITSISPASAILGSPAILLTITGTGFDGSTSVTFGGNATAISEYSSTTLYVIVLPDWLDAAGAITITVTNGGGSASTTFTVTAAAVLIPALAAVLIGNGRYTCGDTGLAYQAILTDGSGNPVNLSVFTGGTLHVQYANQDLALTASVTIADQTVEANLGLVSVPGVGSSLTRQSQAVHEVRMRRADGTLQTFKGTKRLCFKQVYSTP